MKAIITKYIGPTDTRGSRIKASDEDGNSITIGYDHAAERSARVLRTREDCKMNTAETIRQFLRLPAESMPQATWIDSMDDGGSAWPHLRDYVRTETLQRLDHMGEVVRLSADRDDWREGVVVRLA